MNTNPFSYRYKVLLESLTCVTQRTGPTSLRSIRRTDKLSEPKTPGHVPALYHLSYPALSRRSPIVNIFIIFPSQFPLVVYYLTLHVFIYKIFVLTWSVRLWKFNVFSFLLQFQNMFSQVRA